MPREVAREDLARDVRLDEAHHVDEVRSRAEDRRAVLAAAVVLAAEEVLPAVDVAEVVLDRGGEVRDLEAGEAAAKRVGDRCGGARGGRHRRQRLVEVGPRKAGVELRALGEPVDPVGDDRGRGVVAGRGDPLDVVQVARDRVEPLVGLDVREDPRLVGLRDPLEVERLEVRAAGGEIEAEQLDVLVRVGELRHELHSVGRALDALLRADRRVVEDLLEAQPRVPVDEALRLLEGLLDRRGLRAHVGLRGEDLALVEQRLELVERGRDRLRQRVARLEARDERVGREGRLHPRGHERRVLLARQAGRDLDAVGAQHLDPVVLVEVDEVERLRDLPARDRVDLGLLDLLGQRRVAVQESVEADRRAERLRVRLGQGARRDEGADSGVVERRLGEALRRDRVRLRLGQRGDRRDPVEARQLEVALEVRVRRERHVGGQRSDRIGRRDERRDLALRLVEHLALDAVRLERVDQVGLDVAALARRHVDGRHCVLQVLRGVGEVIGDRRLRPVGRRRMQVGQELRVVLLELGRGLVRGGVQLEEIGSVQAGARARSPSGAAGASRACAWMRHGSSNPHS